MRTIENDIPEVFLELAREGISLGLSEVNLGFMYLDSDFISPTEWGLWLTKREGGSRAQEYLLVTMGRSESEKAPTAYIPNAESPLGGTYWGPDEIRAWMREPLEAESEWIIAWNPVEDSDAQEKLLDFWPLFELGVRSGWTMQYSAQWNRLHEFRQITERRGNDAEELPVPLKLEWSISNSFYNADGHPANRDTGAPVSIRGWGSIFFGKENCHEPVVNGDGHVWLADLSRSTVEETLSANHPWFVRVAYNDEEQEDWLHFPEALRAPEETLDPSKF